jgi:low affinity Fe/Cu permease
VVLAVSKEAEIEVEIAEVVSKEAVTVIQLLVVLVWIAKASLTVLTKTWYV